jgi:rubrerythrin
MKTKLSTHEVSRALEAEIELQACYRQMVKEAPTPKVRALLHDLLLMEEMNEVLLRSLSRSLART